jgi:uncharacterized protein
MTFVHSPVSFDASPSADPHYVTLVKFLLQPFLESPSALKIDCEVSSGKPRVWIRVAFEGEDKGRVFGRGGRNIQAIRTVVSAVAQAAGHTVYLDVFGGQPTSDRDKKEVKFNGGRSPSRRERIH